MDFPYSDHPLLKKFPLYIYSVFQKTLDKDINSPLRDGNLVSIYNHLFGILGDKKTNVQLMFAYDTYMGTSHSGESGKNFWFEQFHKFMRQCDLFTDSYVIRDCGEIFTLEDEKEYRRLFDIVKADGYDKYSKIEGEYMTADYKKYLNLWEKRRIKTDKESIGGHLDMLLWNTIHMDTKGYLHDLMVECFDRLTYAIKDYDEQKKKSKVKGEVNA